MQRDLSIGNHVNEWIVTDGPVKENAKTKMKLTCSCGHEQWFDVGYINRSNFSKSCRSCSQKRRRKKTGKFVVGYKNKNLTIISEPYHYKGNSYYKVRCDCGHEYNTGHSTLSKKDRLGYCNKCFQKSAKRPKRNTMLTDTISLTYYKILMRQANLRGIDFELSPEYLERIWKEQDGRCALSGTELNIQKSFSKKENRNKHTASLDRIDSNKGYVEGNVQWVLKDVNYMKLDMTQTKFISLCKQIAAYNANLEPS